MPKPAATGFQYEESVIHSFAGGTDGAFPTSSILVGSTGVLFGTTSSGGGGKFQCGAPGCGTLFALRPGAGFDEKILHRFMDRKDGESPRAGLTFGADGSLFGTDLGRLPNNQCTGTCAGVVFRLGPSDDGGLDRFDAMDAAFTLSPLKRFGQTKVDGAFPTAPVVVGPDGALYGTTENGGDDAACTGGCGVAYVLRPSAGAYRPTNIHVFEGPDGATPASGLIIDAHGALYGTTQEGGGGCGSSGCGVVYKLTPTGSGYTESVLYDFHGGSDGAAPLGGLLADANHVLYGTTELGGLGLGTVYKLTPSHGGYVETVLYAFTGGSDGAYPLYENLIEDDKGALYGTTASAGDFECGLGSGCGTVFRLARSHGKYVATVLHAFAGGPDGTYPYAGVSVDSHGVLYGTTYQGGVGIFDCTGPSGPTGCGTVFELTPFAGATPPFTRHGL